MTKKKSLSKSFAELENITEEFEKGEINIEEAIPKFKKGLKLAKELKEKLNEIENEIEEVKKEFEELDEEPEKAAEEIQDIAF